MPPEPSSICHAQESRIPSRETGGAIERSHTSCNALVLVIAKVLEHDLLVGLNLQELEDQASKRGGAATPSKCASNIVKSFNGDVHQRASIQAEAVLLPEAAVVDALTQQLLDQVLLTTGGAQW